MKKIYIERNKLFKSIPMILLNNIMEIDEDFFEDNMDLFFYPCEECEGKTDEEQPKCESCMGEGRHECEYYQYFLADMETYEVERLKSYGVSVGYSEKLEKHIICISDFGTSWSDFSYSKEVEDDYTLSFDETLTRQTVY